MARKAKPEVAAPTPPPVQEEPVAAFDIESIAPSPAPAPAPEQVAQHLEDGLGLQQFYVNFARVTSSPEELILDFGLNPTPFGAQTEPIQIQRRLVVNFFTAKRLLAALNMSVQRHEQVFGFLETDVNRRVRPEARA